MGVESQRAPIEVPLKEEVAKVETDSAGSQLPAGAWAREMAQLGNKAEHSPDLRKEVADLGLTFEAMDGMAEEALLRRAVTADIRGKWESPQELTNYLASNFKLPEHQALNIFEYSRELASILTEKAPQSLNAKELEALAGRLQGYMSVIGNLPPECRQYVIDLCYLRLEELGSNPGAIFSKLAERRIAFPKSTYQIRDGLIDALKALPLEPGSMSAEEGKACSGLTKSAADALKGLEGLSKMRQEYAVAKMYGELGEKAETQLAFCEEYGVPVPLPASSVSGRLVEVLSKPLPQDGDSASWAALTKEIDQLAFAMDKWSLSRQAAILRLVELKLAEKAPAIFEKIREHGVSLPYSDREVAEMPMKVLKRLAPHATAQQMEELRREIEKIGTAGCSKLLALLDKERGGPWVRAWEATKDWTAEVKKWLVQTLAGEQKEELQVSVPPTSLHQKPLAELSPTEAAQVCRQKMDQVAEGQLSFADLNSWLKGLKDHLRDRVVQRRLVDQETEREAFRSEFQKMGLGPIEYLRERLGSRSDLRESEQLLMAAAYGARAVERAKKIEAAIDNHLLQLGRGNPRLKPNRVLHAILPDEGQGKQGAELKRFQAELQASFELYDELSRNRDSDLVADVVRTGIDCPWRDRAIELSRAIKSFLETSLDGKPAAHRAEIQANFIKLLRDERYYLRGAKLFLTGSPSEAATPAAREAIGKIDRDIKNRLQGAGLSDSELETLLHP